MTETSGSGLREEVMPSLPSELIPHRSAPIAKRFVRIR